MSHLLWLAVPGGRTRAGEGILRVLVVPVLDRGVGLAEEGLGTWPPAALAAPDARLTVEVAPAVGEPPAVTLRPAPRLEVVDGLWDRFFGAIEVVAPGVPIERGLEVEPTSEHVDRVETTYRDVARQLTDEDSRPDFEATALTRIQGFAGARAPQAAPAAPRARAERVVDFHLATSVLREHPAVLRALGLILELRLSAAEVAQLPQRGVVRVAWEGAPAGIPEPRPRWTSLLRDRFRAAPRPDSDLHPAGAMVALAREGGEGPLWRLHTLDADAALSGLAEAAERNGAGRAVLPALRTAGVLLARAGRGGELGRRASRNGAADAALTADDLVLGYRVDVKELGAPWHSLCRRLARYAVDQVEFARDLPEEGHVKVGGGIDHGDDVLRADEVVARWDGWSLAAPRPRLRDEPPPARNPNLPFHLDTDLRPEPGTLLRLRFGETYQLRARVADLAGGGPGLEESSPDGCDSQPVRFTRHEPLLPPDVRLPAGVDPASFGPGAAVATLVLRSADGLPDGPADTVRDLVAPSASFEVVDRHGGLTGDPDRTLELLARSDLPDPAAGGVVGFVRGDPGEPPRDLETRDWTGPGGADPWPDLTPKRLELRARTGDEPTLDWETDTLLVVRLAPAEECTVEISSLIADGAKVAFSISDWLKGGEGAAAAGEDLLASGRHPMATPAHRVRVRHAVRAPRGIPAGDVAVHRAEGSTFATLRPADGGDPRLGVDPPSTVAVDVAASWRPLEDPGDPPVERRPVGHIALGRADGALPAFRHEFGDTKHRTVTYTLTGLSRFRDCFAEAPDADFQTRGDLASVSVPSSARPAPPVVRSVTPGFTWQEERPAGGPIVRRRLGNRVRVELAPPWFATGDGERLGIVVLPPGADPASAGHVTTAGRDPVWDTDAMAPFPVPVGTAVAVPLAEGGTGLLVPHGAWPAGDGWFADVVFPEQTSYGALVRLAVARHQPSSLPGLELSPVVRTDFVPLLPTRTCTVEAGPAGAAVTVEGVAPRGVVPNRVDVVLERRLPEGAPEIAEAATLGAASSWTVVDAARGRVGQRILIASPGTTDPLRVRIREVENVAVEHSPRLGTLDELDERVVFTDVVEL